MKLSRFALLFAMSLSLPCAFGQATGERGMLEQKRELAQRTLTQSAGAKRVDASDNVEAKRLLAAARQQFEKGKAALEGNDLAAADALFSDALKQASKAIRQVPDAAQRQAELRMQYENTLEEIDAFQQSYADSMQRLGVQSSAVSTEQLRGMVAKAKALAQQGKMEEANGVLSEAHGIMVASMNKLLANKTITYDLKFDTPKAEYDYELARNHDYEQLVPLALANFRPAAGIVSTVEEMLAQGQALRNAAKKAAGGGDYKSALERLQESTGYFQTAVEQAGVVMQQ